jgi:hypothetical protein
MKKRIWEALVYTIPPSVLKHQSVLTGNFIVLSKTFGSLRLRKSWILASIIFWTYGSGR